MSKNKFNKEKFKSILHYIIKKTSDNEKVFTTHLYKMLYFSDFNFYEKFNDLISGETYRKLKYGPAPKHFKEIIEELIQEGKIKKIDINFSSGKKGCRFVSTKSPSFNLKSDEIEEINNSINLLSSMTANQVSEYSHEDTPWKVAKIGEDLDPELVFYRKGIYSVTNNHEYKEDNFA